MFRLKKVLDFDENKKVLNTSTYRQDNHVGEVLEKLRKLPAINNYIEFLDEINNDTLKYIPGKYFIEYDKEKETFYIFKEYNHRLGDFSIFVLKYKPENETILDLTKKIFKIDENKDETVLVSDMFNNFTFIANNIILKIIYTKYMLISNNEKPFTKFKLKSKNGKIRDIVAPHPDIKIHLRDLNRLLQKVYDKRNSEFQVAYKKGKSVKDGAKIHTNNKYVYNIDLKDFYPSCKKELVKRYTDFLFVNTFGRNFIESEFFDIILMDDGLFIGSPISGTLANTIVSKPVAYLNSMCKKLDMKISVYADDMSFSSNKFISKKFILNLFKEAFEKYSLDGYFKINKKKCVGFSKNNRKITGVSINDVDQITVSRAYYRNLRTMLHNLSQNKITVSPEIIRGKIAYALMIDDTGKVKKYLEKYKTTVESFKLYSGIL